MFVNGLGWLELPGAPESLTAMFGYWARVNSSARLAKAASSLVPAGRPIWSMISLVSGCAIAIGASAGRNAPAASPTGNPAFAAAGHSQSIVPSLGHER